MVKTHSLLRGVALSVILGTPSFAQDVGLDTVVVTVEGTEITVAHVLDVKRQLPQQYQTLAEDVLFEGIVDQLVQQQMLTQLVSSSPSWIETSIENERRNLLSSIVVDDIRAGAASDEALQAAYQANYTTGTGELEFHAAHILVDTEGEANNLLTLLEEGADFGELAAEFSTGPSGPRGGDLGWFGKGQMVPEFELAVIGMEVGDVSAPVLTQFGFHVIKLNETRAIM
ncbi:MAG: peptidylprolyl isomerase, partial [Planktomarina sp.]